MNALPRVVVAGGGFAGLETIFYLRHRLGERVHLTLVSERDYFVFKPSMIYIPFGADPEKCKVDLWAPTRRKNIDFIVSRIEDLGLDTRELRTSGGTIPYDYLVVATGAAMHSEEIPGMSDYANSIWTPDEMLRLRVALEHTIERVRRGMRQKLVFLIPPGNRCASPLYELALMTESWLEERHARRDVDMVFVTAEENYVQAYGPRMDSVIHDEFMGRGINGYRGYSVTGIEKNAVQFQGRDRLVYDLLVTFPPYKAKQRFDGLPCDERGFVHVTADSRRVRSYDRVFAVGDAADFPVKQGHLALLQADAAAEHIAADITGRLPHAEAKFEPVQVSVLEAMTHGAFAQVPMDYTGDPQNPVVADDEDAAYRVGVSPLWRGAKKVAGTVLPWRFSHGEPFRAGLTWESVNLGLKAMSKIAAHK